MTKSICYDELDALLQFNCEICRNAEIGCTISRMRALPPKLGGKRCRIRNVTEKILLEHFPGGRSSLCSNANHRIDTRFWQLYSTFRLLRCQSSIALYDITKQEHSLTSDCIYNWAEGLSTDSDYIRNGYTFRAKYRETPGGCTQACTMV